MQSYEVILMEAHHQTQAIDRPLHLRSSSETCSSLQCFKVSVRRSYANYVEQSQGVITWRLFPFLNATTASGIVQHGPSQYHLLRSSLTDKRYPLPTKVAGNYVPLSSKCDNQCSRQAMESLCTLPRLQVEQRLHRDPRLLTTLTEQSSSQTILRKS